MCYVWDWRDHCEQLIQGLDRDPLVGARCVFQAHLADRHGRPCLIPVGGGDFPALVSRLLPIHNRDFLLEEYSLIRVHGRGFLVGRGCLVQPHDRDFLVGFRLQVLGRNVPVLLGSVSDLSQMPLFGIAPLVVYLLLDQIHQIDNVHHLNLLLVVGSPLVPVHC